MPVVAIVGAGLIGQGWAIVFARAGWRVRLYDVDAGRLAEGRDLVQQQLHALQAQGLLRDAAAAAACVETAATLEAALADAVYVQENSPEQVDVKRALFQTLDALAGPETILASSTSSIPASQFTDHLAQRHRCLVAHPVNPPYLVPVVEISGAPWTGEQAISRTRDILAAVGQRPVVVRKEIEGFILNRLQGALLQEAFRLVRDGVASVEDIDTTVKDGLGLRWSFMGPLETIDLNAPGGIADYCARYGAMYASIGASQAECPVWDGTLVDTLSRERREALPAEDLASRRFWRDEQLMRLMRHKQQQSGETNG
ncbi:3-hydroxyacyl-CoA dehydrogenase [Bordetella bronchialis]|uniref:3-hydroxyacyl-CoA dehydrogenase n=1 Tax=Bordetella bronchialis TaxID=463025 RepID=A0A193FXV8_9BORD|nr:3-hydroxyacyl-CoA dehydrogenase [Bordetella bronchialis]ANN72602.1 3-hydroxyacyl-CoA dehydrogenase [Bordetella bronchialis]